MDTGTGNGHKAGLSSRGRGAAPYLLEETNFHMIRGVRILSVLLLSALPMARAMALPMQPEECERARVEQGALAASGTAEDVARGGEWGRANLTDDRLRKVQRWIELEEQILFRCPRPKPVPQTAGGTVDGQQGPGDKAEKGTAGVEPASQGAKKKKPAAGAPAGEASSGEPATDVPVKPKAQIQAPAKAKPKPKPKVDDAYIPPLPYGGEEYHNPTPGIAVPGDTGSALAP